MQDAGSLALTTPSPSNFNTPANLDFPAGKWGLKRKAVIICEPGLQANACDVVIASMPSSKRSYLQGHSYTTHRAGHKP